MVQRMDPSFPEPDAEMQRLADLHAYDILDTAPEETYEDLTALAAKLCGRPMAAITFIDEHRQWVKAEVGGGAEDTARSESFCAHAIADPEDVYVVEDASKHPAFEENPYVVGDPGIRFYAGAPITSFRGNGLGTICVLDSEPGDLSEDESAALEALSRTLTMQLELRRRGRELRRAVEDMELVASAVGGDVQKDLSTVHTALGTLAEHVDEDETEAREELAAGREAARSLARSIGGLEEYVDLARRRDPRDPTPLADALEQAKAEAELPDDVRIEAHGLPVAWADRRQLVTLLGNLVGLLVDLTDARSPIHATAHRGEQRWRIELSSETDDVSQARRKATQAGLASQTPPGPEEGELWGVALCRRIVDHHGGQIGLSPGEDRLGVWFTLPGPEASPQT